MSNSVSAVAGLTPAQQQVLVALKKRGEASVGELAGTVGITPSGVRQHLAALRSAGLVAARQERGRPGRPVDVYHSTELAETLVAKPAADLTLELLEHIEGEDPQLLARIFERRRRRRVEQAREQLSGRTLGEKVAGLAAIFDEEGYLADYEELPDGTYRMTLHSCAIWGVASRYGHACTTELTFLRDVLAETEVERVTHKVAGALVCGYDIRPVQAKHRSSARQAGPRRSTA